MRLIYKIFASLLTLTCCFFGVGCTKNASTPEGSGTSPSTSNSGTQKPAQAPAPGKLHKEEITEGRGAEAKSGKNSQRPLHRMADRWKEV